jgi:hypothetical protein
VNLRAIANPIPDAPPVIIAVLRIFGAIIQIFWNAER